MHMAGPTPFQQFLQSWHRSAGAIGGKCSPHDERWCAPVNMQRPSNLKRQQFVTSRVQQVHAQYT
jgi:hypothetical protein